MQLVSVCSVSALIGAALTFSFGGWTEMLTFLLVAMGIDYITGVTAAIKEKKGLNSVVGFWGLARKGLMLLIILLAHRIDLLLDSGEITIGAAIGFYIANELISIIENCGRIGLPVPERMKKMIEVLKDREK